MTIAHPFSGRGKPKPKTRSDVGRYPSGQIRHIDRGERPEQVMKTALDARRRHLGVAKEDASDPLLGSALGRLRRLGTSAGGISGVQYGAGVRFARCMSLQGMLDDVRPAYGVPILARMSCASGSDPYSRFDPDQAWDATDAKNRLAMIARVRQDAADATAALWTLERDHRGAAYLVNRVTMWDDLHCLAGSESKMGALRCGLNALARIWRLDERLGVGY